MAYTMHMNDGSSYRVVAAASVRPLATDNAWLELLGDANEQVGVVPAEHLIVAEKS